jgi:hypothetical protein
MTILWKYDEKRLNAVAAYGTSGLHPRDAPFAAKNF